MTDALLSVRNLRVEFPTRRGILTAIDDVSFDIMPGEVLGVVGESGAGKSLTGAAIIGLLEPPGRIAAGEILLKGQRIDNLDAEAMRRIRGKRIGMVFQDPLTSLNPLYTVAQQLIETIRTHADISEAEARSRAVALLDRVGIPAAARRIDDYPHHFSGGMRQRVVIALALCAEPELVIADEPTTALDVSVQSQIIDLIKEICAERGAAVMLITRLAEIGSVREVITAAEHPYTAGLMGSIPTLTQDNARLVQIPGAMPRLNAIPQGCAFNPRCDRAFDRCFKDRPDPLDRGNGRKVACWLFDEVGAAAKEKANV